MADTHVSAGGYVGTNLAGSKIGRMVYDRAYDLKPFYFPAVGTWGTWTDGYQDATDFNYYTLSSAWGAWETVPSLNNLYSVALAAGTYIPIGYAWNQIDDALENGSQNMIGSTYDERIENWEDFLNTIDSQVSWIWGNVREGGSGFLKYDNNSVFVISTYGTYTKEINGETEYKIAATASNVVRSLAYWNQDGAFVVWNRNRTTDDTKISWTTSNTFSSTGVYVATDPESNVIVPNDIIYSGHGANFENILYNGNTRFDSLGNSIEVPVLLVSMPSIGSAYSGYDSDIYYPEHIIDDASWICDEYNNGIQESPSLGGDDTDDDGDGSYDNTSYDIPSTSLDRFTVDAQDCGFVTVYKVPKDTLKSFGAWLFSSHPSSFWDWIDEIKKIWDNPMDCIMSLNLCVYNANTGGEKDISFFGQASGFKAPIVDGLTQIFDCGYLVTEDGSGKLKEYSGNFLDYGGQSTISAFIPYCGVHKLSTNEVMGAKLHLQYVIDLLTGACVAELEVHRDRGYVTEDPSLDSVLYRFTGNIFQQIPIGATNYSSILQGQLGLAASAMSAVTGNVGGAISGALNSVLSMSPQVERIGNTGSSYGYMSTQVPFIIQEYPWYNWNDKYDNFMGRPLYQYNYLRDCDGFTRVDPGTLWVDEFEGITKEEEDMLKTILNADGIYIDHTAAYYDYDPEA